MTVDGALLLLLALLLPLRLLSFLRRPDPRSHPPSARSVALFASVALMLTAILALSDGRSEDEAAVVAEVEQLKAKTAQLESYLQESKDSLNSKSLLLEDKDKLANNMEQKIQILQYDLHEIKGSMTSLLHTEERIRAMEEEVKHLSDQSRKNIRDINVLESLADDAKEKLDNSAAEVEKVQSIITEQWIQIQQLEQAFQLTKIMTAKVLKRHNSHHRGQTPGKHIMMKVQQFLSSVGRQKVANEVNLPDSFFLGAFSWSCISQIQKILNSIMTLVQSTHYELQESVRYVMQQNKFTTSVSNEFVVFMLASAIMAIPMVSSWIALSYIFDQEEED